MKALQERRNLRRQEILAQKNPKAAEVRNSVFGLSYLPLLLLYLPFVNIKQGSKNRLLLASLFVATATHARGCDACMDMFL